MNLIFYLIHAGYQTDRCSVHHVQWCLLLRRWISIDPDCNTQRFQFTQRLQFGAILWAAALHRMAQKSFGYQEGNDRENYFSACQICCLTDTVTRSNLGYKKLIISRSAQTWYIRPNRVLLIMDYVRSLYFHWFDHFILVCCLSL